MRVVFIGIESIGKESMDIRQRLVYEVAKKLIHQYGMDVTVICDKEHTAQKDTNAIKLLYSDYAKSKNEWMFYYDSLKKALNHGDIIYSFGYLGGLFSFLIPKDKKFITNIDRLVYKSYKTNIAAEYLFKLFYYLTSQSSDILLCNSYALEQYLLETYAPKNTKVIEYGAHINRYLTNYDHKSKSLLAHYNLMKESYHLVIASPKAQNSVEIIIQGYQRSSRHFPLVIVAQMRKSLYCYRLKKIANLSVIFIEDTLQKEQLDILRANAANYIHGDTLGNDSHRLLEAIAAKKSILAHDNLFNREFLGEYGLYWRSPNELNRVINKVESQPIRYGRNIEYNYKKIITYYNWREISKRYYKLFKDLGSEK